MPWVCLYPPPPPQITRKAELAAFGKQSKLFFSNRTHIPQKKWWPLSVPSIPHLQRWRRGCIAPNLSGSKSEKKFQTSWIAPLAMQASYNENINGSFQILRPINFVHEAHQIGGVLYNPPTTKPGGSSSSTLVMTTSLGCPEPITRVSNRQNQRRTKPAECTTDVLLRASSHTKGHEQRNQIMDMASIATERKKKSNTGWLLFAHMFISFCAVEKTRPSLLPGRV